jgi:hypothetical protein
MPVIRTTSTPKPALTIKVLRANGTVEDYRMPGPLRRAWNRLCAKMRRA